MNPSPPFPKSDQLLSVVLLFTATSIDHVERYVKQTAALLTDICDQYQIIVVQDGGSQLPAGRMRQLLAEVEGLRYICLARTVGLEQALSAGLDAAIGDLCLTAVPTKDPLEQIPRFFAAGQRDGGLVVGQRLNPGKEGGLFFQLGKRIFHWISDHVQDSNFPKNTTLMVCLDRESLNVINQAGERVRYLRALTSNVGLPVQTLPYDLVDDAYRLRSFGSSVSLSIEILFMNSTHPLRLVTFSSLALSVLNLLYVGYVLSVYTFKANVAPGWATLSLQLSVGLFLLFTMMAVFSEYMIRMLGEIRDRPAYFVCRDVVGPVAVSNPDLRNLTGRAHDGAGLG